MKLVKIIILIYLFSINILNASSLSFDMSDEVNDFNEKIQGEASKIAHSQQKAIIKLLSLDQPLAYSISGARGWCYSIRDKDGMNGCLAGIKLAEDDISGARGWCYSIRDKDGMNGCLAGIKLAEEDLNGARGWCYSIKDKDSMYGCLSDVALAGYFIKQVENSNNNSYYEVNQLSEEVTQLENELSSDKSEALEMIAELESCLECLDDPETKELYLQLKGDL